ncbi:MAG: hypothetical protein ACRC0F_09875, partial [Cetobacterium sp.]
MRKLKKINGLHYKYQKLVDELKKINETLFIDLIIDLYNLTDLKTTFTFLVNHDFQNLIFEIIYLINNSESNANLILEDMIHKNNSRVELTIKRLEIDTIDKFLEIIESESISYNKISFSDSMYVLYANTSKNYNKIFYDLSLKSLKKTNEYFSKKPRTEFKKMIELKDNLSNSLVENELNLFFKKEYSISREQQVEMLENISDLLKAEWKRDEKKIIFD